MNKTLKKLIDARRISKALWQKALAADGMPGDTVFACLSRDNPYDRPVNRANSLLQRTLLESLGRNVPPWNLG